MLAFLSNVVNRISEKDIIYGNSYQNNGNGRRKGSRKGFGEQQSKEREKSPEVSLLDRVREILVRYWYSESEQVGALQNLAADFGRPYRDIALLARVIQEGDYLKSEVRSQKLEVRRTK